MCENCSEKQDIIDRLELENKDLIYQIKTLETELTRIDKWQASYPR